MKLVFFAIIVFAIYTYMDRSKQEAYIDPVVHLTPEEQSLVFAGRTDIESIRAGISRDNKRNTFRGSRPYPEKLSINNKHLFDNVLLVPMNVGSSTGWKSIGQASYQYTYSNTGQNVVYQYNNQNGDFSCVSSYEDCALFN